MRRPLFLGGTAPSCSEGRWWIVQETWPAPTPTPNPSPQGGGGYLRATLRRRCTDDAKQGVRACMIPAAAPECPPPPCGEGLGVGVRESRRAWPRDAAAYQGPSATGPFSLCNSYFFARGALSNLNAVLPHILPDIDSSADGARDAGAVASRIEPTPGLPGRFQERTPEMDIFVLAIGVVFFAMCFAYVKACDIL